MRKAHEHVAHSIKGASANVGGEALREVALEMETAAKAGDMELLTSRMPELVKQFELFKNHVQGFVHHNTTAT